MLFSQVGAKVGKIILKKILTVIKYAVYLCHKTKKVIPFRGVA